MVFNVNVYSGLLLIGFVQGMVYSGLLFWRGWTQNKRSDKLLAFILLVCCLYISHYMLGFAGWYDERDVRTSFMFYFPLDNILLLGPALYFYFRSLTNHHFKFQQRDIWHWVPGLLVLFLYVVTFVWDIVIFHLIQGNELCCMDATKGPFRDYFEDNVGMFLDAAASISILTYLVLTLRNYRAYRTYVLNNFSDTQNIEFTWLRNLLYVFAAGLLVSWMVSFAFYFADEPSYKLNWYAYLAVSVMLYIVSIAGYHRNLHLPVLQFDAAPDPVEALPATAATVEISDEMHAWKAKVLALMQEERSYLEADLTLTEMARRLKTNASTLSRVINSGFSQNFNDFINSRRVAAVQERLRDPATAHLTLLGIATECGFNSKATFNRAFRKFTGMSPKEFLEHK